MTTLITLRQPLELLSMSDQPVRRSKRQPGSLAHDPWKGGAGVAEGQMLTRRTAADYEQDDDFQFVRKSKKAKTEDSQPVALPVRKSRGRPSAAAVAARERVVRESIGGDEEVELIAAETAPRSTTTTKKSASSRRKASSDAIQDEPPVKVSKRGTRKSTRISNEDASLEDQQQQQPPPRTNGSSTTQGRSKKAAKPKVPPPVMQTQEEEEEDMSEAESPVQETAHAPTKIALPMSDTPIINRNKEMRKKGGNGSRRSSLGSRGRRASSLIESGQTAIPHREVSTSAFYKHIEADLLEPRRMKQLLIWCGERALSAKPRGTLNSGAVLGARAIQDQLLKDFASRSEFSDWFNREDKAPKAPVILKPNPRNIELDEKLQEEKKAWLAIRKLPPEQPALFTPKEKEAETITLPDFDLLDPDEGQIRGFLVDETNSFATIRSQTQARLRNIQSSLEFEVDQLADNIHKLEQRIKVAGKEADRVLSLSAVRLREREERERKRAGTKDMPIMEVLRSLSSILPEGGG
ncbi:Mis12-Mtw1 protein family domain-containing protein [Trichoderma chlorosporum]